MSKNRRIRKQAFGLLSACSVGCTAALPHMPLAGQARLPIPNIGTPSAPQSRPSDNKSLAPTPLQPTEFSHIPNTSPSPIFPYPQSSGDLMPTPQNSATSPPASSTVVVIIPIPPIEQASDSSSVWIENPQAAIIAVREEETIHTAFIEEAHSIIVETADALSGESSVSLRVSAQAPSELDLHRIRLESYGSSDFVGRIRVASSSSTVTFATSQGGEYLIGGDETYEPPREISVPMQQPAQESLSLDSNSDDISAASLRAMRRRVASVSNLLRVKKYIQEQSFRVRPIILFLHGMGERNPGGLWSHITTYLKTSASNKEQLKGTVFLIPTYNSLQAVHVSALRLKQLIIERIGAAPMIIACHSMGCLVARDFAADPDIKDHIVGGVMLAGANGSPWMPKKRMRRSLAEQPDSTALLTAQTLALAKVMPNIVESFSPSKPLSSLVESLDEGTVSRGALSLATGRDDIPTHAYRIKLRLGLYPLLFNETLSPDDAYTLPCSNEYFPQWPLERRIRYGKCYANFVRELRAWERQQGLDTVPRWYAYAGYFRGNELRAARETFLRRLASIQLVTQFITDTGERMREEGLKFLASLLADRAIKNGKPKRLSDGLVDVEDAWLENDGVLLESASSRRDDMRIDMAIAEQRRPADVIALRAFFRDHSQIVRGLNANDTELFEPIAKDFGALLAAYRGQDTSYSDGELTSVRNEVKQEYAASEGLYDAGGTIIGAKTTQAVFRQAIPCEGIALCVDLPFDVITTTDNWKTGQQAQATIKTDTRRAYKIWRAWRLFDG